MTLAGAIVALILLMCGKKPKKWKRCIYFECGSGWGGFNLGMFFLTAKNSSTHIKDHEHGHAVQNCILGPFMPFIITIPSALRYWYIEMRYYQRGEKPLKPYESIWFESTATKFGENIK